MERKLGEIFEYNGEWYQCVESQDGSCKHCDMNFEGKCPIPIKECTESGRSDKSYVIFKKLEKVGEPYEHYEKLYQCYKLPMKTEIRLLPDNCYPIGKDNLVEIEIKQNREDMEEKKYELEKLLAMFVNSKITYAEYEEKLEDYYKSKYGKGNIEEKELNLKEFNLEAAKQGKPVCTRGGRKARIICFDKLNDYYPIIALVDIDGKECIFQYTNNGEYLDGNENTSQNNLIMLPEKKEGWINVKKDASLFKSREEAERNCTKDYVPVRIEFEI